MSLLGDEGAAWQAQGASAAPGAVRLVLVDIDGVITRGEGYPADLPVLARLSEFNRLAQHDATVPAVTLCTGRPAPYVEAMAQMCDVFLPCSFEHGAGLFYPRAFRYLFHPRLGLDYAARLAAVRAALDEPLLRPGRAFVQPGKEASMTLYPLDGVSLDEVMDAAQGALDPLDLGFSVARGILGVEVRPPDMDKGEGARWLAAEVGVPLEAFAGVGDADTDLSFLVLVGHAFAPSNATPAVRAAVHRVAASPFGEGLLEILDGVVAANRR